MKRMVLRTVLALSVLTGGIYLSACGGGGGGGGNNPPPATGPTAPPATGVLRVSTGTAHAAFSHFRAAFNNAGQGVAVWEENSGAAIRILWSYFDGAAFSPEAELVQYGANPTVATNGADFMIVWENGYIYYAACSSSGAVGAPTRLNTASGNYPELASNGTGYAAVWSQSGSLYASTSTAGVWDTPALIENNPNPTYGILKMASNGTGYAVAYLDNFNRAYSVLHTGGTWTAETRLDTGTAADKPDIASNNGGYAVAWHQDGHVYASLNSAGTSTWLTPYKLDAQSGDAGTPAIAASSSGYAVSWSQSDGAGINHIYANLYSGSSWTQPVSVGSGTGSVRDPSIASNGSGYAVAWDQSDGTTAYTAANIFSAGSWTSPSQLSDGTSDALSPLTVNVMGAYGVVWHQDDGSGAPNIFGASLNADGSVNGVLTVVQRAGLPWKGTGLSPKIATNRDGVSLAAWKEYDKGAWKLYGSINSSGAWGTPFLIDPDIREHALATNGLSFMAAWTTNSTMQLMAAVCSSSGALGSPRVIAPGPLLPRYISMASDGSGYAVAWLQYPDIYANIYSSGTWSTDGGGNPTPWLLENGTGTAYYPVVASNGSGYAVAWYQQDGTPWNIYANIYSSGTWSTGGSLLESGGGNAYGPAIASNGTGYATVWYQNDGTGVYRTYANICSSGTWSTDGTMIDNVVTSASWPAIASDGSGYAAVWVQVPQGGTDLSIYANVYSAGTWTTARTLENGTGGAFNPSIASDGAGYAVAWSQYDSSNILSIYANTYVNGTWLMNSVDPAPVLLETSDRFANSSMVTSNGNTYSAVWEMADPLDPLAYDIQAKLGFAAP